MMDKNYISAELENKMSVNENPFPFAHIEGLLPTEIAKKAEIEFLEFNKLENAGNKRYQNTKVVFNEFENMPGTIKDIISFFVFKTIYASSRKNLTFLLLSLIGVYTEVECINLLMGFS